MGRFGAVCLVVLCALVVAAPVFADPNLSKAENKMVSGLVDRYVKDLVLRENLDDGWSISGPQMRGGMSRKAWDSGRALPVPHLRLVGHTWADAWEVTESTYNEYGLDVSLRVGHGKNVEHWDEEMVLDRIHGKWLVNALYTNAVIRLGGGHQHHGSCVGSKCQITGLNDFAAGAGAGERLGSGPAGRGGWLGVVVGGIAGIPLAALLAYALYVRSRNRRAWAEYHANPNRVS